VVVPKNVCGNRVASHRLSHLDTMTPVLGWYTSRVQLPADYLVGFAI